MHEDYQFLRRLDRDPGNLIQGLQIAQNALGFISDETIQRLAAHYGVPVVEVEGVVSFYAKFKRSRPGKYRLTVCDGTACHVKKSTGLLTAIRQALQLPEGQSTTPDYLFSVETVSCLGTCGMAPVMLVNEEVHGLMSPDKVLHLIEQIRKKEEGQNHVC